METIDRGEKKVSPGNRLFSTRHFSANSSFLYLVGGQIISGLAGLLYAKLSAWFISPDQLGIYNLGFVLMTFVHTLVIIPSIQSFRASLLHNAHNEVINFYLRVLVLIYLVLAILLLAWGLISGFADYSLLIGIATLGQGFYTLSNDFLNTTGHQRRFALLQVALASGNVLLFALVVVWGGYRSATGIWMVMAVLNVLMACLSIGAAFRSDRFFRWNYWTIDQFRNSVFIKPWLTFIGPLFFVGFFVCVNNYMDRYLIWYFCTNEDVGQYSMGYSLGAKLLLLATPFTYYIAPKIFQARAAGASPAEMSALFFFVFRWYLPLAIAAVGLYFLLYDRIGALLLSSAYEPAYLIGPLVASGYILFTVTQMLDMKFYAYRQTNYILWHNAAGAVSNLALNLLLIPLFGITGAALATIGGFAVQLLTALLFFKRVEAYGR
jgi:O-antigen/teichoic acid export membrane protein